MSLYVLFESPKKYALYCVICMKNFTSLFERGLGMCLMVFTFAGSADMPSLKNTYPDHRTLSLFHSHLSCLKVNPLFFRAYRTLCRLQLCISRVLSTGGGEAGGGGRGEASPPKSQHPPKVFLKKIKSHFKY